MTTPLIIQIVAYLFICGVLAVVVGEIIKEFGIFTPSLGEGLTTIGFYMVAGSIGAFVILVLYTYIAIRVTGGPPFPL